MDDKDILISHINSKTYIGRSVLYRKEGDECIIHGMNLLRVIMDENVMLKEYAAFFFNTRYFKRLVDSIKKDAVNQSSFSITDFCKLEVPVPDIDYQKRVLQVLLPIDRKIALNRKINAELEQMAKELYDYWFVQFDFPNAEGKPYKSSGGKMVYNPQLKRDIPEGWEVKSVVDCTDVLYGYPFSTEMFVEEHIGNPVIRIRNIQDGTSSAFTTEEVDEKYRVEDGDVVLGMDGNFHCSIWHNNESFLNQRCVRFRVFENTPYTPFSIYFSLQPYIEQKQRTIIGSTVGHLLDSDIREMYLLTPNVEWRTIKSAFLSLSNKIIKNKRETTELVVLRDQLLPLLMNGQVKKL